MLRQEDINEYVKIKSVYNGYFLLKYYYDFFFISIIKIFMRYDNYLNYLVCIIGYNFLIYIGKYID